MRHYLIYWINACSDQANAVQPSVSFPVYSVFFCPFHSLLLLFLLAAAAFDFHWGYCYKYSLGTKCIVFLCHALLYFFLFLHSFFSWAYELEIGSILFSGGFFFSFIERCGKPIHRFCTIASIRTPSKFSLAMGKWKRNTPLCWTQCCAILDQNKCYHFEYITNIYAIGWNQIIIHLYSVH